MNSEPAQASPGPGPCPGLEAIERAVSQDDWDPSVRAHVDACAECQAQERLVRENREFLRGMLEQLGPDAEPVVFNPDVLPGYRLVREIARGGQGIVYEGVQIDTKRRVAVKMLQPGTGRSLHGRKRIEREAEISAGLRHPNIVSVYASAPMPDGRYALAMEYISGLPLDEWAAAIDAAAYADRAAAKEAVRLKLRTFAAVCDAVQYAHQNGVIHRDLKPANILVPEDGVPRVLDFGIARRITPEPGITQAGQFAGTLAYASPEQVSSGQEGVDTRSDVYSLGVILYQVLTGRRPYDTERSLTGAIANITKSAPEPVRSLLPGHQAAGDELPMIVVRALAKERTERYQTAGELKADIENYLAGRAVSARRESAMYLIRKAAAQHRSAFTVVAVLLVVLVGFAILMAWSARRLDRQRSLLAESLTQSTLERARLLGANGSNLRAEKLIWPELLRSGADPFDPQIGFVSTPEATRAVWALFELNSRHPTIASIRLSAPFCTAVFDGNSRVRALAGDGSERDFSLPDGRPIGDRALIQPCLPVTPRFSQNGGFAVTFQSDRIRLLDLNARDWKDFEHPDFATLVDVDVNADGSRLVTVDSESRMLLWSTRPLAKLAVLGQNADLATRPLFNYAGDLLCAGVNRGVRVWTSADGRSIGDWPVPERIWVAAGGRGVRCAEISADRKTLAAVVGTNILVFSMSDPAAPPEELAAHRGYIASMAISAGSDCLVTTAQEPSCRVFDLAGRRQKSGFEINDRLLFRPAVSPDGRYAATCDAESVMRVWETTPRAWLTRLRGPANSVSAVRFSPDGKLVAAASADGTLRAWTTDEHSPVWSMECEGTLLSLGFSPDGRTVVAGTEDGRLLKCSPGETAVQLLARGPVYATWVSYSPDGNLLAVCGADALVHLLDPTSGKELRTLTGHSSRAVEGVFWPDSSRLATAGTDGTVIIWDLVHGRPLRRLEAHSAAVRSVALSPDGLQLASGGDDRTIRLWNPDTGECTRTMGDVKQHVFGLAWHPAGHLLFSCCRDLPLQVWDVRTGRELAVLDGHEAVVLGLTLSPDGRRLATASADRSVGVWDLGYYQQHIRGCADAWRTAGPATPEPIGQRSIEPALKPPPG